MIKTFTMKNFRCFRELTVGPLARVNLITGGNNTGKTALLEGLWINSTGANPTAPVGLAPFRGQEQLPLEPEFLWGPLFHEWNRDLPARLEARSEVGSTTIVVLSVGSVTTIPASPSANGTVAVPLESPSVGSVLSLEAVNERGGRAVASATVLPEGISFSPNKVLPLRKVKYITVRHLAGKEEITTWSKIEDRQEEPVVTEVLRSLDPRVRSIRTAFPANVPLFRVSVGGGRWIPLHLFGAGMSRLLAMIVGMVEAAGGILLVDEIENGIHHSVMEKVWRAVDAASKRLDVQVFATTHSYECITAAHAAMKDHPDDLAVVRMERRDDGEISAVRMKSQSISTALEHGMEVR